MASPFAGGVDPYDWNNWGTVQDITYSAEKKDGKEVPGGYLIQCSQQKGDLNLGIVDYYCDRNPVDLTMLSNANSGRKYVKYYEDPTNAFNITAPCNDAKYSTCLEKNRFWYNRDWQQEMSASGMTEGCCYDQPANDGNRRDCNIAQEFPDQDFSTCRTSLCPPDVWYGNSKCTPAYMSLCTPDQWTDSTDWAKGNLSDKFTGNENTMLAENPCDFYMSNAPEQFRQNLLLTQLNAWADDRQQNGIKDGDAFLPVLKKYCGVNGGYGGACVPFLQRGCSKVTMEQLSTSKDPNLLETCGCYLPSGEYPYPGVLPVECNSTCSLAAANGGVPLYEMNVGKGSNGNNTFTPRVCKQNTCVLDSASVTYIQTTTGTTDISQLCGCPQGVCTCVMSNVNVDALNSVIKGGVDISQQCGLCTSVVDGVPTSISCSGSSVEGYKRTTPTKKTNSKKTPTKGRWWIILIVMVVTIVVIVAIFLFKKYIRCCN